MCMSSILWVLLLLLNSGITSSDAQAQKQQCSLPVSECVKVGNATCLGTPLPYKMTSIELAWDSKSAIEVQQKLELWSRLRNVPRCWEVIQPFLCSVYMPKCENVNENLTTINAPSMELCERTRDPCKVVSTYSEWPEFLTCNASHFKQGCNDDLKVVKFNTTGKCEAPLVSTNNKDSWYKDIEGCGIPCMNPLFTKEEHNMIHVLIAVCGSLCMASTLFTILTFAIDWKAGNQYPGLIMLFINVCFFVGSIGWMAQFLPGAWEDIVCRRDGTMRQAEPQTKSGETISCVVTFVLVYYFMMAGVMWYMILAYAWLLTIRVQRDFMESKRGHFHLVAWTFPLVLTIVCMALTQIDGDSVSGICFVGYLNHVYRGGFVLLPIGLVIVVGLAFLGKGLYTLCVINKSSPGLISETDSAKIREFIRKLGIFAFSALSCVIITFSVHVYIFTNEPRWEKSFEEYLICEANVTGLLSNTPRTKACVLESTPNLPAIGIHIFTYFAAGIIMSMWSWNKNTITAWKRFISTRILKKEDPKSMMRVKKHKIIATAYRKRHTMKHGRFEISYCSSLEDPMGMKFDMNSVESQEMSSTWAAAIPRFTERRGGILQHRRFSDSDIQSLRSSVQQVSAVLESQGLSMESQSQVSHPSGSEPTYEERRPKKKFRRRKRRRNDVYPIQVPNFFTETSSNGGDQASLDRKSSFLSSGDARQNSIPSSVVSSSSAPIGYVEKMQEQGEMNPAYLPDVEMEGLEIEDLENESDIEERPASEITVRSSDTEAMSIGRCDSQATVRSSDSEAMSYKRCSSQSTVRSSDTDAMSIKDFVLPSPIPSPVPSPTPIIEALDISQEKKALRESAKFFKPIQVPRGEITSYFPTFPASQGNTTFSMFGSKSGSGLSNVEAPTWSANEPKFSVRKLGVNMNNNNMDLLPKAPGSVIEMQEIKKPKVIRPKRRVKKPSPEQPPPAYNIIRSAFTPVATVPRAVMVESNPRSPRSSPDGSPGPQSQPAPVPKQSKYRPGSPRPMGLTGPGYYYDPNSHRPLITPRRHNRKSRRVNPYYDESRA